MSRSPIPSIVLRYLTGRTGFTRVVTAFSVTGIMLGVAALIVVMTVMNGFRDELLSRILGITGHATVYMRDLDVDNARVLIPELTKISSVESATPYITGQGMLLSQRGAAGGFVRGVQYQDIPELIQKNIIEGELTSFSGLNTVVLGNRLAQMLGVKVGDTVTLVSPDGSQTVVGFIPRMAPLKVIALFNVGMYQYDEGMILTNMATAQRFYRLGQRISALDIMVKVPEQVQSSVPLLQDVLGEDASIVTWQQSNREFFGALEVERVSMFIILSLIVLVAAFNIITGQMMLVGDKRADIGILRTLGATATQIQKIFLFNGLALGGIGTLAGTGLGLIIVWQLQNIVGGIEKLTGASIFSGEAYFLDKIPQSLVWGDIFTILAIALFLTLLASIIPARKASKMNIVETLRDA